MIIVWLFILWRFIVVLWYICLSSECFWLIWLVQCFKKVFHHCIDQIATIKSKWRARCWIQLKMKKKWISFWFCQRSVQLKILEKNWKKCPLTSRDSNLELQEKIWKCSQCTRNAKNAINFSKTMVFQLIHIVSECSNVTFAGRQSVTNLACNDTWRIIKDIPRNVFVAFGSQTRKAIKPTCVR